MLVWDVGSKKGVVVMGSALIQLQSEEPNVDNWKENKKFLMIYYRINTSPLKR